MEWSDRILYGTDIGRWQEAEQDEQRMAQYRRTFQILETGDIVKGGFFGGPEIQGLDLPRDVLEKIYYKNAMRIYPGIRERMMELGYTIDP